MAPIRTSVLGAGMSLQVFHYPLIASHPDLFTLHSVLERSAEVSSSGEVVKSLARDRCGPNVKVCRSLDEVLQDKEVDLVVIGLPPVLHFDYAKKCLEAGKHVLIEKPITVHAADGKALIDLAKNKGLVLYTYQNRRWDADFLAVQQVLKSGKLGQLNEFVSHYDRYKPIAALPNPTVWKEQPGHANDSIYNLGAHLIDQALVLFGRPKEVLGISWPMRGVQGLDDSFILHMKYPPTHPLSKPYPLIVTLSASILSPMQTQLRFCIKGDKGSFTKYGLDPQESAMKAFDPKGIKVGDEGWGKEDEKLYGTLEVVGDDFVTFSKSTVPTPNGSYQVLYRDLYKAIRENVPQDDWLVNPADSVLTIEVVEAGLLSSKEGRWVSL